VSIPPPVYNPPFNVTRASHAVLTVKDLAKRGERHSGAPRSGEPGIHHDMKLDSGLAPAARPGMKALITPRARGR